MTAFFNNVFSVIFLAITISTAAFASELIGRGTRATLNEDQTQIAYFDRDTSNPQLVVKDTKSGDTLYRGDTVSSAYKFKFNHQSNLLAVILNATKVGVLNLKTGELQHQFELKSQGFRFVTEEHETAGILSQRQSIDFSPDSRFIAVRVSSYGCRGKSPNKLALLDLANNSIHVRPEQNGEMPGDVGFSDDSTALYVYDICGGANTAHWWSTQNTSNYLSLGTLGWGVYSANIGNWQEHALRLAEGSKWYLSRVGLYNRYSQSFSWISSEMNFGTKMLMPQRSGELLVTANGKLLYFNGKSEALLAARPNEQESRVECARDQIAVSADWKFATSIGIDLRGGYYIIVWNLADGSVLNQTKLHRNITIDKIRSIHVSSSERTVSLYSQDHETLEIRKSAFKF